MKTKRNLKRREKVLGTYRDRQFTSLWYIVATLVILIG